MVHKTNLTFWDAVLTCWLISGPFNVLWTMLHLLLATYFTFSAGDWLLMLGDSWVTWFSGWNLIAIVGIVGIVFHYICIQILTFFYALLYVALSPGARKGVVGEHVFEITDDGLIESTEMNKTILSWNTLGRTKQLFGILFLNFGGDRWHTIPRRSFANHAAEQEFLSQLKAKCAN